MTIFGNVCLALAALIFLGPFQSHLHGPIERGQHGLSGTMVMVALWLAPMGLLLTLALCASAARGGLDWLGWTRPWQYTTVIVVNLTMVVATWFSGAMRGEPASQTPWVIRPFVPWAAYLMPLGILLSCAALLNLELSSAIPTLAARFPLIASAALAVLISAGLLGELLVSMQQRDNARLEERINNQNRRDETILQEVQAMDPEKDLRELLNFTNKFEIAPIRDLARKKVYSRSNLTAGIAECLRNGCRDEAFTFLESNDAPDPRVLAEPVREAFALAAADVLQRVQSDERLYDDTFDWTAVKMLAIADRFQPYGVDYAPPLREFRKALDQPRPQKINPSCRSSLDQWLAKAAKRASSK